MKFEIGDKVKCIDPGNMFYGNVGKVYNAQDTHVDVEYSGNGFSRIPSQSLNTSLDRYFDIGDTVRINDPYSAAYYATGNIVSISIDGYYNINLGYTLTTIQVEPAKLLPVRNNPVTSVNGQVAPTTSYTGTTTLNTGGSVQPRQGYVFGAGAVNSTVITEPTKCQHTFKFYQGLNQRFEFCTKCDHKRDTDRYA